MPTTWSDVYDSNSPLRCVLDRLAEKWTLLILGRLLEGSAHFGALHRSLGISKKVLTDHLRRLERDGLIARRVAPGRIAAVDYSLTPLGKSTCEPITALRAWAERHHDQVRASRDAYDRALDRSRDVA